MPKNKISEYSTTASENTDIGGINIAEGMSPSDVNNAMREQMSQLKEFLDGSSGDTLTSAKIVATTAEILSGVDVTGTATFNSAVVISSSVTGSALSLSGALTVGGAAILSSTLGVTGTASMGVIDATSLEVTNIKAKDGTASATIADSTGVMTVASAVLTTADINGGTADNLVIGGSTPAAGTFTTGTATTFTATTVDSTNLEVTNLKAKDGTSAGSIADSTGVVTLNSAVLTTADINGGTADNVVIGSGTPAAATFTTGTATTFNATTVDSTNLEVTNIKAKDGTAAATIADSTGVVTIASAVLTTADVNGGTIDNAAIGSATPSTGAFTTLSSNSTTTLNGTTIPASKTLLVSTDIGSTVQGYDAQLADIAGLTPTDGNFIVGDGTNFIAESGSTARTSLGLGTIATQAADNVDIDGGAVDGITLGTNSAVTEAQIDNININGNTIVSSDTDGDLNLTPNGTGDLVLDGLKWPQADGTADYVLKTDGSGQLSWTAQTGGGGTPGGSDTQIQYNSSGSFAGASGLVTDGSNLTINAQGDLRFADSDSSNWVAFQAPATIASNVTWTLPDADGTSGQVLSTDGSGALSWVSGGGSSISAGDSSVAVTDAGTGKIEFTVDNVEVADFTTGEVVFNETGANQDFRVEGDTNANLLFVDASTDRVGIGTSLPSQQLHLANADDAIVLIESTGSDATDDATIQLKTTNGTFTIQNDRSLGTSGALTFAGNTANNIVIDHNSGNVGIGTNSPNISGGASGSTALTISASASARNGIIELKGTRVSNEQVVSYIRTFNNSGATPITDIQSIRGIDDTSGTLAFSTSNTERMRITSGGEVYIAGTTDQGAYNLQVNGTGVWGAGAYVNGSDERLKENIESIESGLDVVSAIRPVTFTYKKDYSKDQDVQTGFIAQELQQAMDGKNYVNGIVQQGPEYLNVAYQSLIPILTKAIQELKAELDIVKAELATLKGQ